MTKHWLLYLTADTFGLNKSAFPNYVKTPTVILKIVPGVGLLATVAKNVRNQTGNVIKLYVTRHGQVLLMGMHLISLDV